MPAAKLPTPPRVLAMIAARLAPVGVGPLPCVGVGVLDAALLLVLVLVLGVGFVVRPGPFVLVVGDVMVGLDVAGDEVEVGVTNGEVEVSVGGSLVEVVRTTFTTRPGVVVHSHS